VASTSTLVASTCVFVLILISSDTLFPAKCRGFAPRVAPRWNPGVCRLHLAHLPMSERRFGGPCLPLIFCDGPPYDV
jgi:hypothetical protein